MAGAVAWGVVWMVCQAVAPAVIGKAIDAGLNGRSGRALMLWGLILLVAGLGQSVAGISRHRFSITNYLAAAYQTMQITVRQAIRLGSTLPRAMRTGDVVAIGSTDIGHVGNAVEITGRGVGSAVAVVTVTVILLTASVPLGLVVVFGVPLLMGIVGLLIRPLQRRQAEYREQQGRLTGRATDLVNGLRVLRGVGGEAVMSSRYRLDSQRLRAAGLRTAQVEASIEAAQVLLPGIFLVLVTWLGARFALPGRITVGQLVSFYGYAAFLVSPLRQLTETLDKVTRGHVSAARVVRLIGVRGHLADADGPAPARWADDLSDPSSGVVIRAGRITAIAADDPADAVAIADRLCRYDEGGRIGEVPLRAVPLADVRRHVLAADNDARLFSGPLRADLDPESSGRLPAALEVAQASGIVDALPHGLDSQVAERGRTFSGGEQQRLRLARALVVDPDYLVLVEPTSAVDAHTEARIAARLGPARAGRTTVVCSTSPLVLDGADHVIHVSDGRVAGEGTHRSLLRESPAYVRTVLRE